MNPILKSCQWLADQSSSQALHGSVWVYPLVESVHVLTLCLFVGFAVLLDLRLLGVIFRKLPVSDIAQRLLPWTTTGFVLMTISGALLFYSNPVKFYGNVFFRMKLVMLVLAGLNVVIFHSTVYRDVETWNLAPVAPRPARVAGGVSLFLWGCVVVAGRMIAYNWFDK